MSMPLIEALEQVELDAGGTYRCRVKGRWVEVRVLDAEPLGLEKPLMASDVLLDPWVELPGTTPGHRCHVQPGIDLPFDVPQIPPE